MSKTFLITGGLGFLGYYLTKELLKEPDNDIILMDNLISSSTKADHFASSNHVIVVKRDITDSQLRLDDIEVDYIINCAGIASPFYYQAHPLETLDVCFIGTRNILELAKRKNARVLQFSSSEIYGNPDRFNVPTKEDYKGFVSSTGPRACYDEGKRVGEALCMTYANKYDVNVSIVRPFNVYGEGMSLNDYRVIPNFTKALIEGQPLKIHGTGSQTRTYCYVSDAINGFLKALTKGKKGEVYNIGNPNPEISVIDLALLMIKLFPNAKRKAIEFIDYPETYPADEPMRRCPDISKAYNDFDYWPVVPIEVGLTKYFESVL